MCAIALQFFCWDDERKLKYFPLVVKESVVRGARLIKVMCLKPNGDGTYSIDPEFNGETGNRWKDHAQIRLIVNAQPVTGEVWREISGGRGGERAWHVVQRGGAAS